MEDEGTAGESGGAVDGDAHLVVIERMSLADCPEGRAVSAAFVDSFGRFMNDEVRPILRRMAHDGAEPQLLVNGLAELLRLTADSIEFPLGHVRTPRST